MKQLTKEEAIEFYEAGKWAHLSFTEITVFQLNQERICMPPHIFFEALSGFLTYDEFKGGEILMDSVKERLNKRFSKILEEMSK